jgi:hypothetical protein
MKHINLRNIALLLLLVVICGAGFGYYMFNKPTARTVSGDADYKVTALGLFKEFSTNSEDATQKYTHKNIEVTGKLKKIEMTDSGTTLYLEGQGDLSSIKCSFDHEQRKTLKNIHDGDLISVFGQFNGVQSMDFIPDMVDISLSRCVIVTKNNR